MFELEVDYECVRELLIEMAEEFDLLGYPKVLEDFEGSGRIGRAVMQPRDESAVKVIHIYMKGLGKELLAEEASLLQKIKTSPGLKQNPQFQQQCKSVILAKKSLEETFQSLKKCFVEPAASPKTPAPTRMAKPSSPLRALPPSSSSLQRMR